jgi:hypothetical protein
VLGETTWGGNPRQNLTLVKPSTASQLAFAQFMSRSSMISGVSSRHGSLHFLGLSEGEVVFLVSAADPEVSIAWL